VKSHGTTPMTRAHPGWPTPTADSAIAVNEQAPARTAAASAVATLPWRSARLGGSLRVIHSPPVDPEAGSAAMLKRVP